MLSEVLLLTHLNFHDQLEPLPQHKYVKKSAIINERPNVSIKVKAKVNHFLKSSFSKWITNLLLISICHIFSFSVCGTGNLWEMGFSKWSVYVSCTLCRKLRISHHTSITLVWKKPFIHTELSSQLKTIRKQTSATSKKVCTFYAYVINVCKIANWFEVTNFPNGLHI